MSDFNTVLLREKIELTDETGSIPGTVDGKAVVRSNRLFLKLEKNGADEKLVIRSHNMHGTLRLAEAVMKDFYWGGLFLPRLNPVDWSAMWMDVQPSYDREYNPYNWCAIYIDGRCVFRTLPSVFVDVIEQCAMLNIDDYDNTMRVTEGAFERLGKSVSITHSSNVAALIADNPAGLRCGIIARDDGHDAVFNFTTAGGAPGVRITHSLGHAAALLEALSLRRIIRELKQIVGTGFATKNTVEKAQLALATGRLITLDKATKEFEKTYTVKYRPEKPAFFTAG
ncbi:MAG: hypothetical protein PW788_07140 [Micavibrio sp.]|nr:hypothetical protein [Micavibrio sp.]